MTNPAILVLIGGILIIIIAIFLKSFVVGFIGIVLLSGAFYYLAFEKAKNKPDRQRFKKGGIVNASEDIKALTQNDKVLSVVKTNFRQDKVDTLIELFSSNNLLEEVRIYNDKDDIYNELLYKYDQVYKYKPIGLYSKLEKDNKNEIEVYVSLNKEDWYSIGYIAKQDKDIVESIMNSKTFFCEWHGDNCKYLDAYEQIADQDNNVFLLYWID